MNIENYIYLNKVKNIINFHAIESKLASTNKEPYFCVVKRKNKQRNKERRLAGQRLRCRFARRGMPFVWDGHMSSASLDVCPPDASLSLSLSTP